MRLGILVGFAPFLAFAVMMRFASSATSLWTAAAMAALLMVRARLQHRSPKILETGTLVLFAALGTYAAAAHARWDVPLVRFMVDAGLLLIVVLSLLLRRPFTLQYAREGVSEEVAQSRLFVRTNYIITGVWAVAMLIGALADLAMHSVANFSGQRGAVLIAAAIGVAVGFTKWYPEHLRRRALTIRQPEA